MQKPVGTSLCNLQGKRQNKKKPQKTKTKQNKKNSVGSQFHKFLERQGSRTSCLEEDRNVYLRPSLYLGVCPCIQVTVMTVVV